MANSLEYLLGQVIQVLESNSACMLHTLNEQNSLQTVLRTYFEPNPKKLLVNHGHSFLFAEDFSIVSATVSLRCHLTSIAHNPTVTIKTMRDCANDNDYDDDDRRESKDMVWQDDIG